MSVKGYVVSSLTLFVGLTPVGCRRSVVAPPQALPSPAAVPSFPGFPGRTKLRSVPPANRLAVPDWSPGRLPDLQIPSPARNPWKPKVAERDWRYIVIHHTATSRGSVESIHETHLARKDANGNPWLGIGYHFVIGNGNGMTDGEIEATFRWRQQLHGAHAGVGDYNNQGIGIALVGNFDQGPPTRAQLAAVKRLVATLKSDYGIAAENVVGHSDIRATACPGRYFPLADVSLTRPGFDYVQRASQTVPESLAELNGSPTP